MAAQILTQLFDPETFTYTYLLADPITKDAIIIDPVLDQVDRDLKMIQDADMQLTWILETHVHADHITGAHRLQQKTGAKIALGKSTHVTCADRLLDDGEIIKLGSFEIKTIFTPGHTNGCTSYYLINHAVFTGDTLMIDGCGRTDFQEGCSEKLFQSVREKLFTLPDNTTLYPSHDYKGKTHSTIGEEKKSNQRLKLSNTKEDFIQIMKSLKLDEPKQIHKAVPANMVCGNLKT